VLLIDNDQQGNSSKFFGAHSYDAPSIADVLTAARNSEGDAIRAAVRPTLYSNLSILPANMNLLRANKEILLDAARPQQTRLLKALIAMNKDGDVFDYAVIDNAPDLTMSAINALVAADDVIIPVKIDKFAFDGLEQLKESIEETRDFNDHIRVAGCVITMFQKNNVCVQGVETLAGKYDLPVFKTVIRKTVRVDETTFAGKPLRVYSENSTAARDYEALVNEYLKM
jgi:chromosome partitioning protein